MNLRENILQAIKLQNVNTAETSKVPAALLSAGTWAFRQRGLTLQDILEKPELGAPAIIDVNSVVNSAIVWPGSGYHNLLVHVFGGKVKFRKQGNIDVVQPRFAKLAEIDDVCLDQLDRHEWIKGIRRVIAEVDAGVGRQTLVGTSSWGPFTLAGQFYGVEKMMSGLYKDKPGIHALLDFMTEVTFRYLAPAIEQGAVILSIAEPTASGDLISLPHFEEFVAPYLDKVIKRLKAKGALITLHICGKIQDRLPLVPGLGVDLMSVDYKVDLNAAQRALNGKVALAGNVNPVLLKEGTPREVAAAAAECLKKTAGDKGFVLMPGCDIPPAVPLENVKAFFDAVESL